MTGGYTHSCSILYEPEASPALHQEDTEESCRRGGDKQQGAQHDAT